jgi:2-C-methyl-D-erythritol 4-phosphate cytidylyltransferase
LVDTLNVIVAAAGSGKRMNKGINKQYLTLRSRPILSYCLEVFEHSPLVNNVLVVVKESEIGFCQKEIVERYGYKKVRKVIAGGAERQDSVWAGLNSLEQSTGLIAVHDGARPFITDQLLTKLVSTAAQWDSAIPGVPVKDTVKLVDNEGFVSKTLDRSRIFFVQTPQVFRLEYLIKAYQKAVEEQFAATDDASIYEKYVGKVKIVPGDYRNIKITTPEDLSYAREIADDLISRGLIIDSGVS